MALLNQRFKLIRRGAGALFVATLLAGVSAIAGSSPAEAQAGPHHFRGHPFVRGHAGFVGPGRFHGGFAPGFGWYAGWPYYPYAYPSYGYVRYYYPQYYYPAYVMPTAVYAMPPRPT